MERFIDEMKLQNIKFHYISENDAVQIMKTEYSASKLMAYAPLFDKYRATEKQGQYIDLDFAYLYDLASLDSQLRKLVICMCLDIEQMLKTRLIADASCIDSKGVVKEFVQENTIFFNTVYSPENMDHVFKRMTRDTTIEELSVSDFLEVIQFGTIQRFVRFFYDQFAPDLYGKAYAPFERYLDSVRRIRNSSAHNNGLISELLNRQYKEEAFEKNTLVLSFLGKNGVRHRTLDTNMSKQAVHDLCCLIHMYVHFLPKELAKNTLEELRKFLQVTCRNNSAYYIKNPALISAHSYLSNVTDVYITYIS
ncbi:MAG: Abi family protein [Ruminococcaceae bacterium]|nr:Abi family protein [Oscillospiraceae bacterium]